MSRIGALLEQMSLADYAEAAQRGIQKRLLDFDFDGIEVAEVMCEPTGELLVSFVDYTGAQLVVVFGVDSTEHAYAMPLLDEKDAIVIDLSALTPPVEMVGMGKMIRMSEMNWMNKSTMLTILAIGDLVGLEPVDVVPNETDAFGNVSLLGLDGSILPAAVKPDAYGEGLVLQRKTKSKLLESYQVIGRGQGKVRLPIVRKLSKMHLSRGQQTILNNCKYNEKSAKSLKVRKVKFKR